MKVLFISQDDLVVEELALGLRLRWPGLLPLHAAKGPAVKSALSNEEPDLVMVCGDVPGLDVWSAIDHIRRLHDTPIVVCTNRSGEMEVVKALEAGADEFIRMPCNLLEVVARVMALMRRVGRIREQTNGTVMSCGDLAINPGTREAFLGSARLPLTPTEFKLLYLLVKNRHVTLTQEFIQRVIWAGDVGAAAAVKKYIQRLRRKLGDDAQNPTWIDTVYGVGYRFLSPAATTAA